MRHIVPALACLALAGCSGSHDRSGADAGTGADSSLPPGDAGGEVDAGDCPRSAVAPSLICTGPSATDPITLRVEGCFCGEELVCDTDITGEDPGGLIDYARVRTSAEACGPLCDGCFALEGSCAVPSRLFTESFAVDVGGFPLPTATNRLAVDTCWTRPPDPGSHVECPGLSGYDVAGGTLCVPSDAGTGSPITVSVVAEAGCDTYSAGCRVERTEGGFVLHPFARDCTCPTCGACPEPVAKTFECLLPALEPGDYTVTWGAETRTLSVTPTGTENRACSGMGE